MGVQEFDILYTLEEFIEIENTKDVPLEFMGDSIHPKSFSSINHNKIVNRINASIDRYLLNKSCEVYSEQIEVILGKDKVKPDVFVVCKNESGAG